MLNLEFGLFQEEPYIEILILCSNETHYYPHFLKREKNGTYEMKEGPFMKKNLKLYILNSIKDMIIKIKSLIRMPIESSKLRMKLTLKSSTLMEL